MSSSRMAESAERENVELERCGGWSKGSTATYEVSASENSLRYPSTLSSEKKRPLVGRFTL
jgi:hypothetical protein